MIVFIAHPKTIEQDELSALVDRIATSDVFPAGTTFVAARDSFLAFEKKHGKPVNWKRWFDYITGLQPGFSAKPVFDAFVVAPSSLVGKATKDIIGEALRRSRPVYRMTPDETVVKATKVVTLDESNFKTGWVVA